MTSLKVDHPDTDERENFALREASGAKSPQRLDVISERVGVVTEMKVGVTCVLERVSGGFVFA